MSETGAPRPRPAPTIEDFLVEPTRDLGDWQWLWKGDHEFPIRSHRGFLGRLLVGWKRLLRPLVKVPQNDLWERQRIFNVVLLDAFREAQQTRVRDDQRIAYLEALHSEGIEELMRHNDALYARVDQKLDRYRREARDLLAGLGAALAHFGAPRNDGNANAPIEAGAGAATAELGQAISEHTYFELERRYRGTEEEIRERIARYLPYLTTRGPVLDLGCGRGEALALLRDHGIAAHGVDGSARMVAACRARGLDAVHGDLFDALAGAPAGSLGGVMSFHVIEHLPVASLDRLVRLAWRALRPDGVLILETPSPLSLVVAARNFWLDPTHVRPVHPQSLALLYELAGFDPIERLDLRPFAAAERLPEIDLASLPAEQRVLADGVNRLRDQLDDLLYGCQDFGLVGVKPETAPPRT